MCLTFYFVLTVENLGTTIEIIHKNKALKKKILLNDNLDEKKLLSSIFKGKSFYINKSTSSSKDYSGKIIFYDDKLSISDYKSSISHLKVDNLNILKGEKIVLKAQVGKGKSTLLCDIFENCPNKSNICYISPIVYLFPGTIIQNIFLEKNHTITQQEKDIMQLLCIDESFLSKSSSTDNLSGGEKKRIAFLRWYFHRRQINLLDEVFSEVEETLIYKMIDIVNSCNETIIITSHDTIVQHLFNTFELGVEK